KRETSIGTAKCHRTRIVICTSVWSGEYSTVAKNLGLAGSRAACARLKPGCRFIYPVNRICAAPSESTWPQNDLSHHESMRERVPVVDEDRVQAGHARPSADRGDDGPEAVDFRFGLHP